ncbi:hypothetical protein OG259_16115 [Streptomyces sp. NBC_00250]|uniref:hypothetical protein n=1 Tax=Streptomyces sp. NBC_00250 TaxID=2903641 RepID=UPI002E297D8F|nr:hypothetical protein [Streptomyces sp. NBC_00250]
MRTALRTAITTALVAGVAITAPALTAGAAFAAGATPAPKAAAPAAAEDAPVRTVQLAGGLSAKVYAKGDQHPYYTATIVRDGQVLGELKAGGGYAQKDTKTIVGYAVTLDSEGKVTAVAVDAANGTLLRTVQLAGGLSAKVYAKGDQHPYYTATVIKGGRTLGELKAGAGYGGKDTAVFAGYSVTLNSDGEVTATAVDTPQGTLVRTETLMTGTVAKIYKVNALHHRAELFRQGHPVGVLQANTRSVAGQDNGEFLVLNPDGTLHNWIGNTAPGVPGIYRLADGTVVELGRKDGVFGLQEIDPATDKGRGYIYNHGGSKVYSFGKAVVVLEQGGSFSAYVPGSSKQAAPQPYGMGGGGQGESTPVVTELGPCTVSTSVSIGAGTKAELFMTRQGPLAEFSAADDNGKDRVFAMVDRAHPSLPKSVGFIGRIVAPNSTTPSLYTKVEGGTAKGATHAFPKLPKGCTAETVPGDTANGATGTGTGTTTHAGQTSVIPKGGVAAGAELGTAGDDTALLAAGAGASFAAAGLGFVVLRRRSAAARV